LVALACTWQISSVPSKQAHNDLPTENKYATTAGKLKFPDGAITVRKIEKTVRKM